MSTLLLQSDIVLDDSRLLPLGFREVGRDNFNAASVQLGTGVSAAELMDFDAGRAVDRLMADPALGAYFLSRTAPSGRFSGATLLWTGAYASSRTEGGESFGVRMVRLKGGDGYDGDNAFGRHLSRVRSLYLQRLREAEFVEVPVRDGQVVADYAFRGAGRSLLEEEERGEDGMFIHVDHYVPVRFRRDTALDGTTGHASRQDAREASFQKWECPFGTSHPAPVIVSSAAEASFLYEKALRGELDWGALFDDLYARGLMKKMGDRDRASFASEYRAQFAWMREQISTDPTLAGKRIVADSLMVPDSSFGRSQYDGAVAPSPAHVLARYINNPILLYTPSHNGVVRALGNPQKREPERFSFEVQEGAAPGTVHILVAGSDTIGGRDPGHRATSKMVRVVKHDSSGTEYVTREKRFVIPPKTEEERAADYAAFSARMDEVLADVPAGMRVVLVTGSASTQGEGVGVGTPRLVERYVRERKGDVSTWNFSRSRPDPVKAREGEEPSNASLGAVLMDHFAECYPVLARRDAAVSFLLDPADEESRVSFRADRAIVGDGAVCLSVAADAYNRNVLSMGSVAASAGLPVVHVQENRVEERQRSFLAAGALVALSALSGEVQLERTMFDGEEPSHWDLRAENNLSYLDSETGVAVPFVTNTYPAAVSVAGQSYHSAYSAFLALVRDGLGLREPEPRDILAAEGDTAALTALWGRMRDAAPAILQERAMRQAVRLMAAADSSFAEALLALDERGVVMPSSTGDTVLFTDLDGNGLNRFGRVLSDERDMLKALREARRLEEEEERRQLLEEANRRQALAAGTRADGEKVANGLPRNLDESRDAVWFLGTNTPDQLVLPDDFHSFEMWNDELGEDPLVREKAMSPYVADGEGGRIDNEFVFLFASDLQAVMGRRHVANRGDSHDLTGCRRTDPKTGEEFQCAFGVPVRFNNKGNEFFNAENLPCSYRLDNDASRFVDSVVLADSAARSEAFRHGMSLCLLGRVRSRDNSVYYPLGNVFLDEVFDARSGAFRPNPHRAPLNADTVNRYTSFLERGRDYPLNCIVLPSASYEAEDLPSAVAGRREELRQAREGGVVRPKRYVSAEGRFLADLNMSLRIANAMAVSLGVPLRFPLREDGRIDLGPGVPETLREVAENKINAFIGVVDAEQLLEGDLPYLERIPMYDVARLSGGVSRTGRELKMRPNDLVYAFGPYDFDTIFNGQVAPLHEMAFRMEDGSVFSLVDSKLSRGVDVGMLNKYLSYSKNDIRNFVVRTNAPGKEQEFLAAVRAYVDRAKRVRVFPRLVRDTEPAVRDQGMAGYVNLLSSNSDSFMGSYVPEVTVMGVPLTTEEGVYAALALRGAGELTKDDVGRIAEVEKTAGSLPGVRMEAMEGLVREMAGDAALPSGEARTKLLQRARFLMGEARRNTDHDIGREATFFNAVGRVRQEAVKDADGNVVGRSEVVEERDVDGGRVSEGYAGKVDARDGFSGYAQISYVLPDGSRGDWFTVTDLDLAKDMVMSMVNRVYRSDAMVLPSEQVLTMLMVSQAVKDAGERFRTMRVEPSVQETPDDKVVRLDRPELPAPGGEAAPEGKEAMEKEGGRLFVSYYGSKSIPDDAFLVQISTSRPEGLEVDVELEALYPSYKTMVGPHKKGEIDDAEYTRRYKEKVLDARKDDILRYVGKVREMAMEEGRDVYMLCYCRPGAFCHRYLVANFLNENGIECRENPADRRLYKEGRVKLVSDDVPAVSAEPELPFPKEGEGAVQEFQGDYRFLSNFWPADVMYQGVLYRSAENAYQAAKCADPADRVRFMGVAPAEAKRMGKTVRLRPGWDAVKDGIMKEIVLDKFTRNPDLRRKLVATGGMALREGNAWGDRYWGVDLSTGEGENRLGRILMDVREGIVRGLPVKEADAAVRHPVKVSSYEGAWTREGVAADSRRLYVFTDNTDRDSGSGIISRSSDYYRRYGDGSHDLHFPTRTAAVIRGLDNAMPVSTQRWYHDGAKGVSGRWTDADADEFRRVVSGEFDAIRERLSSGAYDEVVFPGADGLFGGSISAITEERVPVLHGILEEEYGRFVSWAEAVGREVREESVGDDREIPSPGFEFTESSGGYQQRTRENANADDVDFTFAFAVDFTTYGEKATARAAGSSLVAVDMETGPKGLDLSDAAVERAVERIASSLPEEYLNGESIGVNIAGNGLYTLAAKGVSQDQVDEYVTRVLSGLRGRGVAFRSFRSGGQTGVDEAAYAAGSVLGVHTTVHAPKGWGFRGADGRDHSSKEAFMKRFEGKDLAMLKSKVSAAPSQKKRQPNVKVGQSL